MHQANHDSPLILAHRGLVSDYQENTISAIKAARDSTFCDGCEFDVFLTKDDKVVLCHDQNIKRLTGVDKSIYDMTWDELKRIPIKSEIEVDGGMRHYHGPERFALLSEALEEVKNHDFFVDIELKAYGIHRSRRHVGKEVAKIIKRMEIKEQVVCVSFNFFMLKSLERESRSIHSGYAYDDNMPFSLKWLNRILELNIIGKVFHSTAVAAEYTLIDGDTIKKCHKRNQKIGAYTLFPLTPVEQENKYLASHTAEVKRLASLGVDWIETDNPRMVKSILSESLMMHQH